MCITISLPHNQVVLVLGTVALTIVTIKLDWSSKSLKTKNIWSSEQIEWSGFNDGVLRSIDKNKKKKGRKCKMRVFMVYNIYVVCRSNESS